MMHNVTLNFNPPQFATSGPFGPHLWNNIMTGSFLVQTHQISMLDRYTSHKISYFNIIYFIIFFVCVTFHTLLITAKVHWAAWGDRNGWRPHDCCLLPKYRWQVVMFWPANCLTCPPFATNFKLFEFDLGFECELPFQFFDFAKTRKTWFLVLFFFLYWNKNCWGTGSPWMGFSLDILRWVDNFGWHPCISILSRTPRMSNRRSLTNNVARSTKN